MIAGCFVFSALFTPTNVLHPASQQQYRLMHMCSPVMPIIVYSILMGTAVVSELGLFLLEDNFSGTVCGNVCRMYLARKRKRNFTHIDYTFEDSGFARMWTHQEPSGLLSFLRYHQVSKQIVT